MAIEGLAEERPWLGSPSFEVGQPDPPEPEYEPLSTDGSTFVGVRPDEVMR